MKQPRVNLQAEQEEIQKAMFRSPRQTSVGEGSVQAKTVGKKLKRCLAPSLTVSFKPFLIKPLGVIARYDYS